MTVPGEWSATLKLGLLRSLVYCGGLTFSICGVEMWRDGVGTAYLLPALSSAGASLASPCFRFHIHRVAGAVARPGSHGT